MTTEWDHISGDSCSDPALSQKIFPVKRFESDCDQVIKTKSVLQGQSTMENTMIIPNLQQFTVNRSDDTVDDDDTFDRRDSGFHTMKRAQRSSDDDDLPRANSVGNKMTITNYECKAIGNGFATCQRIQSPVERPKLPVWEKRNSPIISVSNGVSDACKKAKLLADKLFQLDGYSRIDVVKYLSKNDEFHQSVAEKFMQMFNFEKISLENSLRKFVERVVLIGETCERERVLERFTRRFAHCNPDHFHGCFDATHTLVCAIVLLNTDLHHAGAQRVRMTCKQFVRNLDGLGPPAADKSFDPHMLKEVYKSIKKRPLPSPDKNGSSARVTMTSHPAVDVSVKRSSTKRPVAKKTKPVGRSQSTSRAAMDAVNPLLPLSHSAESQGVRSRAVVCGRSKKQTLTRKQGVLWRKTYLECDGTKTAKRKRKWKVYMVALHGLELHLAKKGTVEAVKVSIHHSVADADDDKSRSKRDNVFRVIHANSTVVLFQASSPEERQRWVNAVNRNAALLSAAPLSAAVGSQKKFQKPLQPSSCSTLPLVTQLEQQQSRLSSLLEQLQQVMASQPPSSGEPQLLQFHLDEKNYLMHEVRKYQIYTRCLADLHQSRLPPPDSHHFVEIPPCKKQVEATKLQEASSELSISPSEPGFSRAPITPNHRNGDSASAPPDRSDSLGDLLSSGGPVGHEAVHRAMAQTLMAPTTSLPDLMRGAGQQQPRSPVVHAVAGGRLVPRVTETDDGGNAVRLVRSSNLNNSNRSRDVVALDRSRVRRGTDRHSYMRAISPTTDDFRS